MLTVTKKRQQPSSRSRKPRKERRAVPESGSEEMRYLTSPENQASDSHLATNPILTIGNSSRKASAFLWKVRS
jgi:hypothetical protein